MYKTEIHSRLLKQGFTIYRYIENIVIRKDVRRVIKKKLKKLSIDFFQSTLTADSTYRTMRKVVSY